MTEFWNSDITEASWYGLQKLSKEVDFILIGGWAVYLYSRLQKSKDIDIIIDYDALPALKKRYKVEKNERLTKYEIKLDKYDIDIYLPNYSRLVPPPRDILSDYRDSLEGFSVPTPEALMALKLGAASARLKSPKGMKDAIDALGLLFNSGLDLTQLKAILSRYGLNSYLGLLTTILSTFDKNDLPYLNLNESSFSKLKRKYLENLRKLL